MGRKNKKDTGLIAGQVFVSTEKKSTSRGVKSVNVKRQISIDTVGEDENKRRKMMSSSFGVSGVANVADEPSCPNKQTKTRGYVSFTIHY